MSNSDERDILSARVDELRRIGSRMLKQADEDSWRPGETVYDQFWEIVFERADCEGRIGQIDRAYEARGMREAKSTDWRTKADVFRKEAVQGGMRWEAMLEHVARGLDGWARKDPENRRSAKKSTIRRQLGFRKTEYLQELSVQSREHLD